MLWVPVPVMVSVAVPVAVSVVVVVTIAVAVPPAQAVQVANSPVPSFGWQIPKGTWASAQRKAQQES